MTWYFYTQFFLNPGTRPESLNGMPETVRQEFRQEEVKMANPEKAGIKHSSSDVWAEIRKDVEGLSYGTVLITVHDGKVVQIDTSTKTRFQ